MVMDREAPGSHWLGLARNDFEFAFLTIHVHKINSFVVMSHFGSSTTPNGGSVLVNLIRWTFGKPACIRQLGWLGKAELPPFLLTSQPTEELA